MKQSIAIFFTLLLWLSGLNNAVADEVPPSQNELNSLITNFYNNQGEWAGVFRIGKIERVKLEQHDRGRLIANVRYYYTPVPGNRKGRTDTGYDQRTFTLIMNRHHWTVINMGKYMSAHF